MKHLPAVANRVEEGENRTLTAKQSRRATLEGWVATWSASGARGCPSGSLPWVPYLSTHDRRDRRGPATRAGTPRVGERLGPMPGSHGNTRDSELDTTTDVQVRLTAGGGQSPRITGRNLARLSERGVHLQVRRLSPRLLVYIYTAVLQP